MIKVKNLVLCLLSVIMIISFALCLCFVSVFNVNADDDLTYRWINSVDVDTSVNKGEGDFSLVVMGDQQIALKRYRKYVSATYDYLVKNKDAMNLKMYINVGDMFETVDYCDEINSGVQGDPNGRYAGNADDDIKYFWQQADYNKSEVKKLKDAHIPVALAMGNHDYEDMGYWQRINKTFDYAFPLKDVEPYATDGNTIDEDKYFGGAQYDDIEQAYYYFVNNGQKYMVLVLGFNANAEMVNWAKEVIEDNQDCKIIIASHTFNFEDTYSQWADDLWYDVISRYENIIMTVCGHTSVDGAVLRDMSFGVNGNPIYHFVINTQSEEFGGAGLIGQFIFRANGSVDFTYFAPGVEKYLAELSPKECQGKYFGVENQFSFSLNVKRTEIDNTDEVLVGNTVNSNSLKENYQSYTNSNDRWLQNVYSYKNVYIKNGKGIVADGSGYVVYKLDAGKLNRFKSGLVHILGNIDKKSGDLISIDVSFDGKNYKTAVYRDSYIGEYNLSHLQGRINLGDMVDRFVRGAKDLYIKVILVTNHDTYFTDFNFSGQTVQTVYDGESFEFSYQYNDLTKIGNALDGVYNDNYISYMVNGDKSFLTSGYDLDFRSYSGFLTYRFDAPNNKVFNDFNAQINMDIYNFNRTYTFNDRHVHYQYLDKVWDFTIPGKTYDIKEKDSLFALRVLVSFDDGLTFTEIATYSNKDNLGEGKVFNINFNGVVNDKNNVVVKICIYGAQGWIRLNSVKFSAGYKVIGHSAEYRLNGGKVYYENYLNPFKKGCEFVGWRLNSESGEYVDPIEYKDKNVILFAEWKQIEKKSAEIYLDGGKVYYENYSNPFKKGFTFEGWHLNSLDGEKVDFYEYFNKDVKLYAKWI